MYFITECTWEEYKNKFSGGGTKQKGYMDLDECKEKCLAVSCKGFDYG